MDKALIRDRRGGTTRDRRHDHLNGRRDLVQQLRLAGHSIRSIAAQLGVPHSTVHRDVQAIRAEWAAARMAALDEQAAEDLQRFRAIEQTLWPKTLTGDHRAIAQWLRLQERRARTLGIESPRLVHLQWERALKLEVERIAAVEGLEVEAILGEIASILERADA